jgi:hypothetical protein
MPLLDGSRGLKESSVPENKLNILGSLINLATAAAQKIVNVATLKAQLAIRDIRDLANTKTFKCKVATVVHLDLANTYSTIDGITLSNGDLVLVHLQNDPKDNMIARWSSATLLLTIADSYLDKYNETQSINGTHAWVEQGTWANTLFTLWANIDKPLLGITPVYFFEPKRYTASNGVQLIQNNFSFKAHPLEDALLVSSLGVRIDKSKLPGAGSISAESIIPPYITLVNATGEDTSIDNVALTKTFTVTLNYIRHDATVQIEPPTEDDELAFEQPINIVINRPTGTVVFDLVKKLGIPTGNYETRIVIRNGLTTAFNETATPPFSYTSYYPFTHQIQASLPFVINSVSVTTAGWLQGETRQVSVSLYTNVDITELYELLNFGADFEVVGAFITNNPASGSLVFDVRPIGTFASSANRTLSFGVRSFPYVANNPYSNTVLINRLPFEHTGVSIDTTDWIVGQTRTVSVTLYTNGAITDNYTVIDLGADFTFGTYIDQSADGTLQFTVTPTTRGAKTLTFRVQSGIYATTIPYTNSSIFVYEGLASNELVTAGGYAERLFLGADNTRLLQSTTSALHVNLFIPQYSTRTAKGLRLNTITNNYASIQISDTVVDQIQQSVQSYYDYWIGLVALQGPTTQWKTPVTWQNPYELTHWVRITNNTTASDTSYLAAQFFDTNGAVGGTFNIKGQTIRMVVNDTTVSLKDSSGNDIGGVPRVSTVLPSSTNYFVVSGKTNQGSDVSNYSLLDITEIRLNGEWA